MINEKIPTGKGAISILQLIYKDATIWLDRKRNIYEEFINDLR